MMGQLSFIWAKINAAASDLTNKIAEEKHVQQKNGGPIIFYNKYLHMLTCTSISIPKLYQYKTNCTTDYKTNCNSLKQIVFVKNKLYQMN